MRDEMTDDRWSMTNDQCPMTNVLPHAREPHWSLGIGHWAIATATGGDR